MNTDIGIVSGGCRPDIEAGGGKIQQRLSRSESLEFVEAWFVLIVVDGLICREAEEANLLRLKAFSIDLRTDRVTEWWRGWCRHFIRGIFCSRDKLQGDDVCRDACAGIATAEQNC